MYLLTLLVAITWSSWLRKFWVTLVIPRNRLQCRSMLNGSTTMTLIIHGSRGNHNGSVKHSMIIYGMRTNYRLPLYRPSLPSGLQCIHWTVGVLISFLRVVLISFLMPTKKISVLICSFLIIFNCSLHFE